MSPSRVAVITGAASGIGRACAELFAAKGCGVVAVDLPDADFGWAGSVDGIVTFAGDVSDDAANAAAVQLALDTFGRLDVAVLNAGTVGSPAIEEPGALERLDRILAINVRGVVSGIRNAAPAMRATGESPAIVATASTSGMGGDPGSWAYNASKAAVINLVRAAAMDYGVSGIRINAIAPGPTETGMTAGLSAAPELHESLRRRIPLQRWGLASELAEAAWFLSSPAASFIHGVTLPVDGGLSANAGHFNLPAQPGEKR
jgi:meso-butanediol dehydrogenase/(S,S)-butanediol dehydrogenase/diacetyl reductase